MPANEKCPIFGLKAISCKKAILCTPENENQKVSRSQLFLNGFEVE
jgi:hypothetical protein